MLGGRHHPTWGLRAILLLLGLLFFSGCSASYKQIDQTSEINGKGEITLIKDRDLAQRFSPVFYFHPNEIYYPLPVEVMLATSRVRLQQRLWFDSTVLINPTPQDLFSLPASDKYFLDVWFGDEKSSELTNYTANQVFYKSILRSQSVNPVPTIYAHVEHNESTNHITIQYWILYFYNNWFNKHEGDWELVEVILSSTSQPEWVALSQHHSGTRRPWSQTTIEDETHPAIYVSLGSHASYFVGDEIYPYTQIVGNRQINLVDRTGKSNRLSPQVVLIPDREELRSYPASWPGVEWMMFCGHWGEMGLHKDFSGSMGPADQAEKWETPYAWGMSLPLDPDNWYKNRLRVELLEAEQGETDLRLIDEKGNQLPASEGLGNLAILHTDPPPKVLFAFESHLDTTQDLILTWPDVNARKIVRLWLKDIQIDEFGDNQIEISSQKRAHTGDLNLPDQGLNLFTLGADLGTLALRVLGENSVSKYNQTIQLFAIETRDEIWDAPDLVWMVGVLPISSILLGFLVAFICSLVPTLILVSVLYWVDIYEKEPLSLLALALLWGGIPAVILALVIELFFKLPTGFVSPDTLQALRLGLLAPVLEELFKGLGVIYIYWRHRKEIDSVLDGLIYGATVGFGFAMMTNFLSYVNYFILYGYPGISTGLLVTRTIHALDHGLYSAIFGGTVGFAQLLSKRWQRSLLFPTGILLAICVHSLHNLLSRSLIGLNVYTVIITSAGTLVLWMVGLWSLVKQRRCLQKELKDLLPEAVYRSIINPLANIQTQFTTLIKNGVRDWHRLRRLHHLCIKFSFSKEHADRFPDDTDRSEEIVVLWKAIEGLLLNLKS